MIDKDTLGTRSFESPLYSFVHSHFFWLYHSPLTSFCVYVATLKNPIRNFDFSAIWLFDESPDVYPL